MCDTDVAIVGGGLAGLCAARRLQAAGADYLLTEARNRLGGRILTTDASGQPAEDGFDLGPSWFWPRLQPRIGELVAELGLAAFPQADDGDVVFERMSREAPRRYHADRQEPQSLRLVGGTAALVRALARHLPPARIRLNTRVSAMALSADGIVLTIARGDKAPTTLTASRVIAALPPRLLAADVAFSPALPAETSRRWRATPTWMAPHAKFLAVYTRPFWRAAGLSGTAQSMAGPLAEMHDATTASGKAALFGFVGLSAGARAAIGEAALTAACLDQLARLFGAEAHRPLATLLHDWAADPLTATAADQEAGAHPAPDGTGWVQGLWQGRLLLAGSETSPSEPGYLAGAVTAAALATDTILASLGRRAAALP